MSCGLQRARLIVQLAAEPEALFAVRASSLAARPGWVHAVGPDGRAGLVPAAVFDLDATGVPLAPRRVWPPVARDAPRPAPRGDLAAALIGPAAPAQGPSADDAASDDDVFPAPSLRNTDGRDRSRGGRSEAGLWGAGPDAGPWGAGHGASPASPDPGTQTGGMTRDDIDSAIRAAAATQQGKPGATRRAFLL